MVMVDMEDELEFFQKQIEGIFEPYILISSGGEFSPVYNEEGEPLNRFHQYSIVSASF
jgi:hypothetical protein